LAAVEIENPPAVDLDGAIGLDVCVLAAELDGVLALQIRKRVLKIEIRVG
jgi:hypothetical protein